MANALKSKSKAARDLPLVPLEEYVPMELRDLDDPQTAIPRIARTPELTRAVEAAVQTIPTSHELNLGDARILKGLQPESVHLILTSPPYWTLKEYRDVKGQLGHVQDYERFLDDLDKVWQRCFDALVIGGRLICVVGDVCLSRRKNNGRHTVVPLHAAIQERCRVIGYDNLSPIIWNKIANAVYEVEGAGGFLGKPYEPNAVIKNDIEYILMERKPGGYRTPELAARVLSVISEENHRQWFQQIWNGLTGASTKRHPAPYPQELAERLIRMFSFVGDTVLDPFSGTGTTSVAAALWGRNSVGYEIDETYLALAVNRFHKDTSGLFSNSQLTVNGLK
ncbi:MAG TPA: site-specific DNA-methyltransferase [Planctomycetaceae bacterium]|nr:site-specific DNA-methyltransferase [Planctomycetaceae bacterium]HRA86658.1 site-specific DNA-methyltransferase [Planctomycetaceae bacterium]